jgi:hypothetical protein
MKKLLSNPLRNAFLMLLLFGQFSAASLFAQLDTFSLGTKYAKLPVASNFDNIFKYETDKCNFKKLRTYYSEQTELIAKLATILGTYSRYEYEDTTRIDGAIEMLERVLKKAGTNDKILVNYNDYTYWRAVAYDNLNLLWDNTATADITMETQELQSLKNKLSERRKALKERQEEYLQLLSNIAVLEQDLKSCERTIDEALRPESEDQAFRTQMSIVFASLIGVLLIIFFLLIFMRGNKHIAKDLLSELGLQFITLFVLIIAVILFGILDILKGSELAAILAGISGYILGSKSSRPRDLRDLPQEENAEGKTNPTPKSNPANEPADPEGKQEKGKDPAGG